MFKNKKLNKILENQKEMDSKIHNLEKIMHRMELAIRRAEEKPKKENKDNVTEIAPKPIKKKNKAKKAQSNKIYNTKLTHIAIHPNGKYKDYAIYDELKNPDDMTIEEFSNVLKVPITTLRARLHSIENRHNETWVNNDNFVYYLKKDNTNYLIKVLTRLGQKQIIKRYGYGLVQTGRPRKDA